MVILWNSKNVLEASSSIINSDSFYIWNSSLKEGEKYNFFVKYDLTQFSQIFNEEIEEEITVEITADSSENDDKDWNWTSFLLGIFIGVALTLLICYLIVSFY